VVDEGCIFWMKTSDELRQIFCCMYCHSNSSQLTSSGAT
jgi:hypothetical protein